MEDAARLALAPAQEADAGIGGVRLKVAGRGEETEGPARRLAHLVGVRLPVVHRRDALVLQRLGIDLELARRGAELLDAGMGETDRAGAQRRVCGHRRDGAGGTAEELAQELCL